MLNVKALAVAGAILWAGSFLFIATLNAFVPEYGRAALAAIASIYPGYDGGSSPGAIVVLGLYSVFDGLIGGTIVALVYNAVSRGAATVPRP